MKDLTSHGYQGYWAASDGVIYSTHPWRGSSAPRRLSTSPTRDGYPRVQLYVDGKKVYVCVHVLIALAFCERPSVDSEVRHLNGVPSDCRATNLKWGSHVENIADREKHGRTARGRRIAQAKLSDELVREIRASKETCVRIAARLGVTKNTIDNVRNSRTWRHVETTDGRGMPAATFLEGA